MALTDRIVREKKITTLMVTHNLRFAEQYGTRLCMFDKGHIVLDAAGEEKAQKKVEDLLALFNEICHRMRELSAQASAFGYKNTAAEGACICRLPPPLVHSALPAAGAAGLEILPQTLFLSKEVFRSRKSFGLIVFVLSGS